MRYYVQHGAGLGSLVSEALRADLKQVDVLFQDDSSLIFEATSKRGDVETLPYVKNSFLILGAVPRGSVPGSVNQIAKQIRKRSLLQGLGKGSAFRTMTNIDGQLVGLPKEARERLESTIAEQTGGRLNARGGVGAEYWIVGRRDFGSILLCLRLTTGGKKSGGRGALSADLSQLLIKASAPLREDIFLDPFAGSGSIVEARIAIPFQKAIYSDIKLAEPRAETPVRLLSSRKIEVREEDALLLPSVADGAISSIVTDPPWGEYENLSVPYEEFAAKMMKSFDRVLEKQSGRLVMLVSRRVSDAVVELWQPSNLFVRSSHAILLNGHPATVLVGGR